MTEDVTPVALPRLCVVGSINVDLTAVAARLPGPGETVGGATLRREPGGKGANQAVAAARLGARTRMLGAVGDDVDGRWMLEALRDAGVETSDVRTVADATGSALVVVDRQGENQIVVCPGANRLLTVDGALLDEDEVVLTQLEVPTEVVVRAAAAAGGFLAVNTAPAHSLPPDVVERADLLIANEHEYAQLPELAEASLVAVTHGADGASLVSRGRTIVSAPAVAVEAVSTVGAGDAFSAAITLALAAGLDHLTALEAACAVGAAAVRDPASQPALRHLTAYVPRRGSTWTTNAPDLR